jgi:ABC-type antimicrobial peptide transport system permease subunit
VVILNETAARTLFPDGNAVGGRIGRSPETRGDIEVIGVVRDTKYSSLRTAAPPTMFWSFEQAGGASMTVVLRTAADPAGLAEGVRAAVREIDPALPLTGITTQAEQIENRVSQERLFATAYSLFGGLALLLAAIGLFGVMSYSVARRTNEIGIRMALGARRAHVVRMVLTESMILVGIGVALGLGTAFLGGRAVASVLFGLEAGDALTLASAVGILVVVSIAAGLLPARRAARVDPLVALRVE